MEMETTLRSEMKKEEINLGKAKNITETNPVMKTTILTVVQADSSALSAFLAPRFWPTKVAAAIEKPKQVKYEIDSTRFPIPKAAMVSVPNTAVILFMNK